MAVAFILLLIALIIPQSYAHDLPSNDPSDYIRPYETAVVELANKIGKEPFSDHLLDNIRSAYYWVSWNTKYMYDKDRWGVTDYWQLPSTTISLGTGDCEDHAILLTSLLRALGVPRENVRMAWGWVDWLWGGHAGYHAWVEVKVSKEVAQAFQEMVLEALSSLENATLILQLEGGPLYLKITKETVANARTLSLGEGGGWIPLDPTSTLLTLPSGHKVPIPFAFWMWLGYYVYYLCGVKATPEYFYVDKPWTYNARILLQVGYTHHVDIPCTKGDYMSGYVFRQDTGVGYVNTVVELTDPDGSVIKHFNINASNIGDYIYLYAMKDGVHKLTIRNSGAVDVLLDIDLGIPGKIYILTPLQVEDSVTSAELEYIKTEISGTQLTTTQTVTTTATTITTTKTVTETRTTTITATVTQPVTTTVTQTTTLTQPTTITLTTTQPVTTTKTETVTQTVTQPITTTITQTRTATVTTTQPITATVTQTVTTIVTATPVATTVTYTVTQSPVTSTTTATLTQTVTKTVTAAIPTTQPVTEITKTITVTAKEATSTQAIRLESGESKALIRREARIPIRLSEAPNGLSGFELTVSVNPSVALIKRVEFPGFGLNESSGAPGSNVSLKAVDINNVVKPGDTNSELAVLVIEGISTGDAALNIEVKELDDDHGNPIFAEVKPGRVVVLLSPLPLPAQREPRDLDGDGLFEDLNGNGRLDFADVVLFFKHKDFIEVNWGASLTDFNGNGRLDFDDIVKLFKRV
jgi:hypothetical protein